MLQKEIRSLEEDLGDRINEAVTKAVDQAVTPLREELSKANVEIERQRAIINKDPSNSSKPSSVSFRLSTYIP